MHKSRLNIKHVKVKNMHACMHIVDYETIKLFCIKTCFFDCTALTNETLKQEFSQFISFIHRVKVNVCYKSLNGIQLTRPSMT